jgi:ATP adenylyltransferase/5',5'''-P-1,P-4-tetraphosphate phosphorylase II
MLFAIYLDDLLRNLQRLKFSDGINTNSLAYADLLLARGKEEMRKMSRNGA